MSILFRDQPDRGLERSTVRLPPGYGSLDIAAQMRGSSAVTVTNDSAMRHDAVWSCRTRIAEDVAMMPVDVIYYDGGARREVSPLPQIIAAPSTMTPSAMDWRYQIVMSWTGSGNAWGIVTSTTPDRTLPTRIELKDESSVRFQMAGDSVRIFVDNVEEELWPVGRLWHSPAYTMPGRLLGLSPIQHHATAIGKGMAAGLHGFQYFSDGAHPTSIWKLKGANAEQAATFKARLMELARGNREPMTVDADAVTMERLQSNPTDSQFLDTERYSVEQVCRIFNCDPADHGSSSGGSSITYANRTDSDLARLKRRQYWVTKMQEVLSSFLPDPMMARLNTSSYLMMTATERHALHKVRLDSKTITVNEIRRIEDEAPFDGDEFDTPGIPGGVDAPDDDVDQARAAEHDQLLEVVRSAVTMADERRATSTPPPSFTVHNHVPEGREIVIPAPEVRVDSPVTVNVPEQRATETPNVYVTVDPTPVTVNVDPTPVTIDNRVDVQPAKTAAPVIHMMPADETPSTYKVRRDAQGRISEVEEKG
jgi:HK97 family phage portal protein